MERGGSKSTETLDGNEGEELEGNLVVDGRMERLTKFRKEDRRTGERGTDRTGVEEGGGRRESGGSFNFAV